MKYLTNFHISNYGNCNVDKACSTNKKGPRTAVTITIDMEMILKDNDIIDIEREPGITMDKDLAKMFKASEWSCIVLVIEHAHFPKIRLSKNTEKDTIIRDYECSLLLTENEFEDALNKLKH